MKDVCDFTVLFFGGLTLLVLFIMAMIYYLYYALVKYMGLIKKHEEVLNG